MSQPSISILRHETNQGICAKFTTYTCLKCASEAFHISTLADEKYYYSEPICITLSECYEMDFLTNMTDTVKLFLGQ